MLATDRSLPVRLGRRKTETMAAEPSAKQLIYVDLAKTQLRDLTSTLRRLTPEQQASILAQLPREPFTGPKTSTTIVKRQSVSKGKR